jgi:dolichol kinase
MHATWGLLFASLNHFIPRTVFVPGMIILTTGTLGLELLRYRKGFEWMNEGLHKILGHALRKSEMDGRFTGSFYYFLGVTVTSALYSTSCATLGICQLAIADPTASFFGRATRHIYWSRIGNGLGGLGRNKGFLGFLGGALACVPLNYRLLSLAKFTDPTIVSRSTILLASLALGIAGAFADLIVPTPALTLPKKVYGIRVPPFHVDDNFIVPVVSGWACIQIFQWCDWPSNLALASNLIVR